MYTYFVNRFPEQNVRALGRDPFARVYMHRAEFSSVIRTI